MSFYLKFSVNTLVVRAEIAQSQGNNATAFQLLIKALNIVKEYALELELMVDGLESLARLAISQNQLERAVKLFGAIEVLRTTISYIHASHTHDLLNSSLREARTHLDEANFVCEWDKGHDLMKQVWNLLSLMLRTSWGNKAPIMMNRILGSSSSRKSNTPYLCSQSRTSGLAAMNK